MLTKASPEAPIKTSKDSKLDFVSSASLFSIEGAHGTIPCRSWGSPSKSSAVVVLVHGLNANASWFEPVARQFQLNNIYVVAYDQIGFGQRKSEVIRSYKDWLQDLETVFHYVQEQIGTRPVFLLGNSMGSLICSSVTPKLKPAGLILTAPAFAGHPKAFTIPFTIKTMLKSLVNPRWKIAEPNNIQQITRSPEAQEWILQDEGPHICVPAGVFLQIYLLIKRASRKIALIDCPLFMLTAQYDFIVDNHTSMQVFNKLKGAEKMHKEFAGAYHDLLLDPMFEYITADIIQWMHK